MSAALTLDLDCPPVPRRADWIDALALRAACVGGWNPTPAEFWPRLANLAFFNAPARRIHRGRWSFTPLDWR